MLVPRTRRLHVPLFELSFFPKVIHALRLLYVRFSFAHNFYRTETLIGQICFRQNPKVDLEISRLTAELSFKNPLRDARLKFKMTSIGRNKGTYTLAQKLVWLAEKLKFLEFSTCNKW
jgi:hypothetical protein